MRIRPQSKRPRPLMKREPVGGAAVIRWRYRYSLTRWWEGDTTPALRSRCVWIMLNPQDDDATIGRVASFSRAWGHTSFEVVNLFAYRTSSPSHLWERRCDIVGPQNDDYLRAAVSSGARIVAAWGTGGVSPSSIDGERLRVAVYHLKAMCIPHGRRVWCLGTNQGGSPKHPLYLRASTKLEPFPELSSPPALRSYSPTWMDRA